MKLISLILIFACTSVFAQERSAEILRLKKGEYYYHYLTGDYPTAMNQLGQWRNTDEAIAQEAEVMEAAMLLSLGLHEDAEKVFNGIDSSVIQAAGQSWFFLSRRYFELGEYDKSIKSIQKALSSNLPAHFFAEAKYIEVSSYIEMGMMKIAQQSLSEMPRDDIWTGFARHNFILAMMDGNSSGRGLELLIEDATFYLPETQEAKDLRDRINLISAMHFLESGKNRSAEKHLKQISLAGPYTPAALLQFGWAKIEQRQYEDALQPWRELQVRFNKFDPEVMESMLGVPHVLDLLNAKTQALKTFEVMESRFIAMNERIDKVSAELEKHDWIERWIIQQNNFEWGWQSEYQDTVPFDQTTEVLKDILSENETVALLERYRDVWILSRYLNEKTDGLVLWEQLIERRKTHSTGNDDKAKLAAYEEALRDANSRLDYLKADLAQSQNDMFGFPSKKQNDLVSQLGKSTTNIESLMSVGSKTRNLTQYQERWRRVKGLLAWNVNEQRPAREWAVKKQIVNLEQTIKKAQMQLIETKVSLVWSPQAWKGMSDRIKVMQKQVGIVKGMADTAKQDSKDAILRAAREHLAQQKSRITDYLALTRLSVARLYDDALQESIAAGGFGSDE